MDGHSKCSCGHTKVWSGSKVVCPNRNCQHYGTGVQDAKVQDRYGRDERLKNDGQRRVI